MPKSRLWVVSELYYPEQTSTGYFLTEIAEGLADTFDVQVICGKPSYSERGIATVWREKRRNTTIHRMRATHFNKDRLVLRALNALTLAIAATFFALRHFRRGDRMLIVTNPPTLPPILGLVARIRSVQSFLLVHDVYPEVLVATDMMRAHGAAWRLASAFFNRTLGRFDALVVLGRDMRALIVRKLQAAGAACPVEIIPNWGDVDEISPIDRAANAFAVEHGLVDKVVVQFSGNIGRTHDIALLLEVARRVEDLAEVVFLFVGYGGQAASVANHGAANLRYLPRQPRDRLNQMLACSDLTVIAFKDAMKGVSVPSRMYNVMAAGVPIAAVAEADAELSLTVVENVAGWHVAPGDVDALERLVRDIATPAGQEEAIRRGRNARTALAPRYTLARVLDQYRALLSTPVNGA
ncbi:MAG: glycosyltransferase family 4 protein [Novosphingobium sp.]